MENFTGERYYARKLNQALSAARGGMVDFFQHWTLIFSFHHRSCWQCSHSHCSEECPFHLPMKPFFRCLVVTLGWTMRPLRWSHCSTTLHSFVSRFFQKKGGGGEGSHCVSTPRVLTKLPYWHACCVSLKSDIFFGWAVSVKEGTSCRDELLQRNLNCSILAD